MILAGLVRAFEAGVDVVNLSVGEPNSWSSSAAIKAVENIIALVVMSAGNNGDDPMFTIDSPSVAESAISVASIENDLFYGPSFKASGIDSFIPYTLSYGNTNHFPHHSIPMVTQSYHKMISNTTELCDKKNINFSKNSIKGSLVLVPYQSDCYFSVAKIAKEKDTLGLIIVSEDNSFAGFRVEIETNITTLLITLYYDHALMDIYNATGTVRIKLRGTQGKSYLNQNLIGGTVSVFSSVGPTAEFHFKPEIAGVGGAILSTLPIKYGGWAIYQGNSMASPYVAGSIGLYLAAYGKNAKHDSMSIKEKFMNYAKPAQVYESSALDSPLRQGAGLVQDTHTLTIDNWGQEEVTYRIHNNVSIALTSFDVSNNENYNSPPDSVTRSAGMTFSTDTITVPSQQSVNVTITVDLLDPSLSSHLYYGGFIQFESNDDQHKDMSVPYFGIYGRQKNLPIFSLVDLLYLNDTATGTIFNSTEKESFKFDTNGSNSIALTFSLVTPTSVLKCEIIDDQGEALGYIPLPILLDNYQSPNNVILHNMNRNTNEKPYYRNNVDSYYIPPELLIDNVAAGKIRYQGMGHYRLSALRLLGNPNSRDDWDLLTSSPVEFVYNLALWKHRVQQEMTKDIKVRSFYDGVALEGSIRVFDRPIVTLHL
ncbi:subtilisin-like protein [Backusella circina FSU 941]|nr:subtilisin-like protein [Backusella circina FSU 941]